MDFARPKNRRCSDEASAHLRKRNSPARSRNGTNSSTFRRARPRLAELGCSGFRFPGPGGAGMSAVDYCIAIGWRVDPGWRCRSRPITALLGAHLHVRREARNSTFWLTRTRRRSGPGTDRSTSGSDASRRERRRSVRRLLDLTVRDLHDPRPCRRRWSSRPSPIATGARRLGLHRRARDQGFERGKKERQTRDAGERHERGALRPVPGAGRSPAWRKAGAS